MTHPANQASRTLRAQAQLFRDLLLMLQQPATLAALPSSFREELVFQVRQAYKAEDLPTNYSLETSLDKIGGKPRTCPLCGKLAYHCRCYDPTDATAG